MGFWAISEGPDHGDQCQAIPRQDRPEGRPEPEPSEAPGHSRELEEGAGGEEGEEIGMMVAGCYARKSTDEGDKAADAKSVVRQVQRAREFAAKKGWQFNENFVFTDDGISGAEFAKRPGLNNLLNAIKGKHRPGALIVSEQSRLGRDTIRTLAVIQAII